MAKRTSTTTTNDQTTPKNLRPTAFGPRIKVVFDKKPIYRRSNENPKNVLNNQALTDALTAIRKRYKSRFLEGIVPSIESLLGEEIYSEKQSASVEFSQKSGDELPKLAPAFWSKDRLNDSENAVDFTLRNYRTWMGQGLLREHVAALDPDLGKALENYFSPHTNKRGSKVIPPEFNLPSRKDINDQWVKRIVESRGASELTEDIVKEAARRATAARRELKKGEGSITAEEVRELGREASALQRRWAKERLQR